MKMSIMDGVLLTIDSKSIKTDLYMFKHAEFKPIIAFKDDNNQIWFSLNHMRDILAMPAKMNLFIAQQIVSSDDRILVESEVLADATKIFINRKAIDELCQFRKYALPLMTMVKFKKCINHIVAEMESADIKVIVLQNDQQESVDESESSVSSKKDDLQFTTKIYHHKTFGDIVTFVDSKNQTWFILMQLLKVLGSRNRRLDLVDIIDDSDKIRIDTKPYMSTQVKQIFKENNMICTNSIKIVSARAVFKILKTFTDQSVLKHKLEFIKWLDSLGFKFYEDGPAINEFDFKVYHHKTFGDLTFLLHYATRKVYFRAVDIANLAALKHNRPVRSPMYYTAFPFDNLLYITEDGVDYFILKSKNLSLSLKKELQRWIHITIINLFNKKQQESDHIQVFTHDTFGDLITYKDSNGKFWYMVADIARIVKTTPSNIEAPMYARNKGNNDNDSIKIDLAKFTANLTSMALKYRVGEKLFMSKANVARCIINSQLNKEDKQKVVEWILSIDPISVEEQQELDHIQVFTHDTFGDLITYKDLNGKLYFFMKDLYKLFDLPHRKTIVRKMLQKAGSKLIAINPWIISRFPNLQIGPRLAKRGFIPIEGIKILCKYSQNPNKDKICKWLFSIQQPPSNNHNQSDPHYYNLRVIAKDFGWSAQQLNSLLYRLGVVYPLNLYPQVWGLYQKYSVKGYALTKKNIIKDPISGEMKQVELVTKWTLKGRAFIHKLLAQYGIHPVDQQKQHIQTEDQIPQPISTDDLVESNSITNTSI